MWVGPYLTSSTRYSSTDAADGDKVRHPVRSRTRIATEKFFTVAFMPQMFGNCDRKTKHS